MAIFKSYNSCKKITEQQMKYNHFRMSRKTAYRRWLPSILTAETMGSNHVINVCTFPVITHARASPFLPYNKKHKAA
jgi:hypothetical protein